MTSTDKLNFYASYIPTQNLFQRLAPDSILNGESSSKYWSEYVQTISQHLSSLMPIEPSDLGFHLSNGSVSNMGLNSWFSTKETYLHPQNSLRISCPSSTALVQGFTDCENIKNKSTKRYKKKPRNQTLKLTPNSVKKRRVFPSKQLHRIWKRWLNSYRWIYNWTIAQLRDGENNLAYDLQKLARKQERPDWVKELPGHQLQEAVADAVDAHKQAKANGGVAHFKSCRQPKQVVKFKAGNYKKGQWYPTKVKGLTYRSPEGFPAKCTYGTQLVFERGKWYGIFPEYIEPTATEKSKVIALDPGVRTFMTGYDGEKIVEFGGGDLGKIQRLCNYLDKLMSRIDFSEAKRQRRAMRKAASRIREKIQNLVKDLHNKVARFLVKEFKIIFLPTFSTSEMVVKSRRKLNKKTARNMLTWSHYRFQQHLIQMANRHNVLVVLCNESYTSKTCPECGHIHDKLGGNKKFQCPLCGYSAHRDWNGARNIMLRALQATAFTIVGDAIQIQGA
jgi:putative transposase